jgi:hypothetical protein
VPRRLKPALLAAIAVLCSALLAVPASAEAGRYVTVAKGELDGTTWLFEVQGGNGRRCYAAEQERIDLTGASGSMAVVCQEARAPRGEWRQILTTDVSGGGTLDLQQTSARVHFLEVLLADPSGGNAYEPEWRSLHTHALTRGQRIKAKLGPNFRFAAVASPNAFCVKAVRTFDRNRKLLRERKVPCEY